MIQAVEVLVGDATLQIMAGATLALSVGVAVAVRLSTPRACWEGTGCLLKRGDPGACGTCSIYHDYRMNGSLIQAQPELGEIRGFSVLGSNSD